MDDRRSRLEDNFCKPAPASATMNTKHGAQPRTDTMQMQPRQQIPFQALIIGLMTGDDSAHIDPLCVSSCIFLEDETSETQADGMESKVGLNSSCDC